MTKAEKKKQYYRKNRWKILRKRKTAYHDNVEMYRKRGRKYYKINKEAKLRQRRSVAGRHTVLRRFLRTEKISKKDKLWSLAFYGALIEDKICHYCLGDLNLYGVGLDCMDNSIGHTCFNVVPCCKSCNQKKMHDITYEEMLLLTPILRFLRKRKEGKI